ncbi:MAG: nucleotide sugar dehydrogenase [Armatimonadota bacterium]
MNSWVYDVCIVGGCGHVGLPLALCFAKEGKRVAIFDINSETVWNVSQGHVPFAEEGAESLLLSALSSDKLYVTDSPDVVAQSENIVIVLGTPIDEQFNPSYSAISRAINQCIPYLRDGQLLILRSTVFPGTTVRIGKQINRNNLNVDVVFCPERVLEGKAIIETYSLPQIISGCSPNGVERAKVLFSIFGQECIILNTEEAELGKLFCNAWRYAKFAIVNEFFMTAASHGLDFQKIRDAIRYKYPRMQNMPNSGFTAGPCLLKDTIQLNEYSQASSKIGHAAILVNEGLPGFIVDQLERECSLDDLTVGLLGLAFKGNSDDSRWSLAHKLKKLLNMKAGRVLVTDPYTNDDRIIPVNELISQSDIIILCTPHDVYRNLDLSDKHVVDIWGFLPGLQD